MRKGFYFSFDALLALTVLSASLAVVTQSSSITFDDYQAQEISYRQSSTAGQDAMRLASIETFNQFNESFRQELVEETMMEKEDLNRTILDGISLLWAARNISHAREATDIYFSDKLDSEFRLEVVEEDEPTLIYRSSDTLEEARTVSSSARLVSGHSIDQPSEGFQSRARAVESTTNQTKVINIPMLGSGSYTNNLEVNRKFYVPARKIHDAKFYVSMQWGQSNFDSATMEVNGEDVVDESDFNYLEEKGKAHYAFGKTDITGAVEPGWNNFSMVFPNQDSSNDYHAHIQPGQRVEVTYTEDTRKVKSREWKYLTDVFSEASNSNQKGGVWYNHPIQVPEDKEIEKAVLELDIRNLEDQRKDDLQVFLNDEKIYEESAPVNDKVRLEFGDKLKPGTNVLSIYGNIKLDGGEVEEFTHAGKNGKGPRIYSNPLKEEGSRVKIDYDKGSSDLEFGVIDVTWTEELRELNEPLQLRENPAYFNETFGEDFEIINTFLNVAQLNSIDIEHTAGIHDDRTVFESPRNYSTPSRIETGEDLVQGGETTEYWFEDKCYDGMERDFCSILPESGLEVEIGIPSQVGYGRMFENRSAAVEDAEERLQEQLGEFADATEIEGDTVSTGGQPYLWGPATVRLVIWNE